jgi:2-dehydropantoate 2-reductase
MQKNGLNVESIAGDFNIQPVNAYEKAEQVGQADVIFCCVKSWQVPQAAREMRSIIGPETVVVPLQNGVEAHTILANALGAEHVLPGLCRLISMVTDPGCIRHAGAEPYLAIGEMDGHRSERLEKLFEAFKHVDGMTVDIFLNIHPALWKKFMLIASWGGVGAITRSPIGIIRSMPETRIMLQKSVREIFDVARASGINVEDQAVDDTLAFIDGLPPEATASMQRDITSGRSSELNEQNGAVVRYGKACGVATPINELIYNSLLPLELKARGKLDF